MRAVVTCTAIMVALTVMPPAVDVRAESPVTLTVRLYNTAAIPSAALVAGRRAAEQILHDTGLHVRFRHCGRRPVPDAPVDACDESLKPFEVVVRLIEAPAFNASLHPDAFGVTYVVRETDRGWLATVFSDRIRGAAARAGVDTGTLFGRVMAHEIGHLLLGAGYHGHAGLMRADWPDERLARADDWRFSTAEAARMQRVLASIGF